MKTEVTFNNFTLWLLFCNKSELIFFNNSFIYLFLVVLGRNGRTWAFSSCREQGLCSVAVHGLLFEVASLVAERGFLTQGLQHFQLTGSGLWAQ